MAEILNKDPATYEKEKESFLRELQQFHETRGTPFRTEPKISGRTVDLYLLYALVTGSGGWVKVNSRNEWDKVLEDLKLPQSCVNCSVAVKQVYLRYLDRYEKVHFLGEVGERVSEDDEDSRHKKWSMRALHFVPLSYNHAQHNVNDSLRDNNGLSTNLYKPSEYDKLGLSLLSPLINEQDFAINVCTLLSNEGKHSLKLEKHPRILHYLLAHAAVFSHPNLRHVFTDHYSKSRGHAISRFWDDVLCEKKLQCLIDESQFETTLSALCGCDSDTLLSGSDKKGLTFEPEDKDLFCLGRTLGTQDYVGQRVLQIATILRNLTFIQENLPLMNKDLTFLRFVLLCCGSRWNTLHQMGWDMLGNLAMDLTTQCPLMPDILRMTLRGLYSTDRAEIISSLEVLNKIGQNEKNEDYLLKYLDQTIYEKVCSFLTIHDIMLLIYTLECLYSLSSLGERACNFILKIHGILDTLVSLITVEAQSYGPKACIQMRVVETVSGPTTSSAPSTASTAATPAPSPISTVRSTTPTPIVATPATPAQPAPQPMPTTSSHQASPQTHVITQPSAVIQRVTPTISSNPVHATQQVAQENEQFALSWLRSTYEPNQSTKIEQAELYKQYINYCAKIGRRGVIAPLHFPRCVRSVFGGSVGPKSSSTGETTQQFYEGIQVRAKPLVPQNPQLPQQTHSSLPITPSPILKAHLSAPPKPTPTTPLQTKVTQRQQQHKLLLQSQDAHGDHHAVPVSVGSVISTTIGQCVVPAVSSNSNAGDRPSIQKISTICNISQGTFNTKSVSYKINGVRPNISEGSSVNRDLECDTDSAVTSTSGDTLSGQPPPLAPLSNSNSIKVTSSTADSDTNDDNSLSSMIIIKNNQASSDNSNDSVIVNGLPSNLNNMDDCSNKVILPKNLMLADLLEKHVDKSEPPVLNGSLRIGDRGLELVQGLEEDGSVPSTNTEADINGSSVAKQNRSLKRPSDNDDIMTEVVEAKKPHINGDVTSEEPPEDGNVSSSAANLYAALAADALEDEPIEETTEQPSPMLVTASNQPRPILVTTAGGQLAQRVVVGGQHYVVAQPQTALVQGQTQTVLVAQTAQQQGTGAKTIIILQPQNVAGGTGGPQKVLVQSIQSPPPPPPPLITSSPTSTIVRAKSPPKPSPTPPPQQVLAQPSVSSSIVHTLKQPMLSQGTSGMNISMPVIPAPCATPVTLPASAVPSVSSPQPVSVVSSTANENSSASSPSSSSSEGPSTAKPSTEQGHFLCEWRGCMRNFKSGNEVYMHACEAHCPQGTQEIQCLWERCDAMKRKRFSHMTHLFDRHCNADVMRIMAVRRKQLSTSGRTEIPPPSPPTPHPGYAPNAAFHAIKRHALEFVNPKELQQKVVKPGPMPAPVQIEQDDNEGPVTKSIRLTSALILRNLVIFSTNGRRCLTRFEPHLANVALSSVESSRTIAQVLYDISQPR